MILYYRSNASFVYLLFFNLKLDIKQGTGVNSSTFIKKLYKEKFIEIVRMQMRKNLSTE